METRSFHDRNSQLLFICVHCGIQARLSEVDGENARLKSTLKQKDEEVEGIDKVAKRLQEERGKVADIIRQEFADRYATLRDRSASNVFLQKNWLGKKNWLGVSGPLPKTLTPFRTKSAIFPTLQTCHLISYLVLNDAKGIVNCFCSWSYR